MKLLLKVVKSMDKIKDHYDPNSNLKSYIKGSPS